MPKIADLTIFDNARNRYIFEVYPKASQFDDDAGVYMFTERSVIYFTSVRHNHSETDHSVGGIINGEMLPDWE